MKKFSVRVVALAAGALAAGSALASVNLDTGVTTGTFAKEFNYSTTAAPANPITGALTVSTKLGFGVSGGQNRYIRVDLSGAQLAAASLGLGPNTNTPTDTTNAFSNAVLVAGGTIGATYAIYQVTANAANGATPADAITILVPSLNITNGNASAVTVTYTLYETATAAVANSPNTNLYQNSGALLNFQNGLKFALTPGSQTAAVSTLYQKFNPAAPTVGPVLIGNLVYGVNAPVVKADGVTQVALADLVTAATNASFTTTADFSTVAVNGLFLDNGNACLTTSTLVSLNTANTIGTPVTALGVTANTPNGVNLCYTAKGTVPIAVQTVNAALNVVAAVNSAAASVPAASIGTIAHDGTQLQAPLVQTTPGFISRFVLTNTGSTAATYTGAVTALAGSAVLTNSTLNGTIPAGGSSVIEGAAMPTFDPTVGPARGFVVFTVAGPNNNIQGAYQIVNQATGAISNLVMVRPGTN